MFRLMPFWRLALVAIAMSAASAVSVRAQTQVLEYHGMCEASAAVAAGPDHFFAAEDEGSVLRLYARNDPEPIWKEDLGKKMDVDADDIEAAAAVGNRIYWITSHSRTRKGKAKPERRYLFATDIVGQGAQARLEAAGKPYAGLLDDLLDDPALDAFKLKKAAERTPEEKGGLNIEGLAATAEGKLLIGFRNPVRKGWALVVPLGNPDAVVMRGAKARFGEAMRLDLDGLGIRSLERVGDGYLILAGPFDDEGAGFSLRRWTGAGGARPKVSPQPALADADLKLTPEALFAIPGSDKVQILSDDGNIWRKRHGMDCKDSPEAQRRFRSIVVAP
jgi:Protein of unknown function (DUF3616)